MAKINARACLIGMLAFLATVSLGVAAVDESGTGFTLVQPNVLPSSIKTAAAFGYAVAMSKDGNVAVAAAPNGDATALGGFFGFSRSADGTWAAITDYIQGSDYRTTYCNQGAGLAISGNGEWVAAGGPLDDDNRGAVWLFKRSGNTWIQSGVVREADQSHTAYLGERVAMSSAGTTVAASRRGEADGGVVIFAYANNAWEQQGPRLIGRGADATFSQKGYGLALTDDGNKVIYANWVYNKDDNAVWVFARNASNGWNQVGEKLTAPTPSKGLGASIASSGDGKIFAVGCNDDNTVKGSCSVHIFLQQEDGTYVFAQRITNPTNYTSDFGISLAMSTFGNRLLVGDWDVPLTDDDRHFGSYQMFTRDDSGVWTQVGSYLHPALADTSMGIASNGYTNFGYSIGMDACGTRFIGGGYGEDDYTGAAWFYEAKGLACDTPKSTPSPTSGSTSAGNPPASSTTSSPVSDPGLTTTSSPVKSNAPSRPIEIAPVLVMLSAMMAVIQ